MRRFILPIIAILISGCAYVPKKPLVNGPTSVQPAAGIDPANSGSIYQSTQPVYYAFQPLFEDRRPRNVGDILTISLEEDVSASKNSSSSAGRNGKSSFSASLIPKFLTKLIDGTKWICRWKARVTSVVKAVLMQKIPLKALLP